MDLDALRKEIDALDDEVLRLLSERARHVVEIGRLKQETGATVFDPARERRIMERLLAATSGPLSAEAVREVFASIFSVSRLLEKQLVVAYYGPAGSFTHIAARRKFGAGADFRPCDTIADVSVAVEKGDADFGVMPIENTTAGVVPLTLDALVESKLKIAAEVYVDIEHYLLSGCPDLAGVARVYSHPQALAQCRVWLKSNLPRADLIPVGSTARGAELAAREPGAAAIGPALAGELYDVPVLAEKVHDHAGNRTRFFVCGRTESMPSGRDKTSLVFSVAHKSGALYQALGVFGQHDISMTFIQSHPTKQTPWEYMFFVDLEGHSQEEGVAQALRELRDHTHTLRVLGSYPEAV